MFQTGSFKMFRDLQIDLSVNTSVFAYNYSFLMYNFGLSASF